MTSEIKITVDGQELTAQAGQMLIEVTDQAGISVPRFCYHNKLSTAANCRMCLVEVEKAPKPLPACATPLMDGMVVHTKSPTAIAAQKSTMEFLLINHPLDCPICDQGGECELQDVAMGYGNDVSRFSEGKRVVPNPDLGALIATDMTRCIHCTRCVRFGEEIAGIRELGATGRGEHMKIGTYIQKSMGSELSANIIDLCPVGALTAKPSRFKARPWELRQYPSISPHDSFGSHLYLHVRRNEIIRAVPKNNEDINECWLSDRDRFSTSGLYAENRLDKPMLKEDGEWQECDWDKALKVIALSLSNNGKNLQTLISAHSTLEELYLAQKLTRALGSDQIEHRFQQSDFRHSKADPLLPYLGITYNELEKQDVILTLGLNIHKDQPLLGHRIRKATLAGAKLMQINSVDFALNMPVFAQEIIAPSQFFNSLAGIAKALGAKSTLTKNIKPTESQKEMAETLRLAEDPAILLGEQISAHPDYSLIRQLTADIANHIKANWGVVPALGNSVGAWIAGAVPHRLAGGKASDTRPQAPEQVENIKDILLINMDPALDIANAQGLNQQLAQAENVFALTAYQTPALLAQADVLLPIAQFTETSGTFVNGQGDIQSFKGVAEPFEQSRPTWKVLRVLGNLLNKKGFEFNSSSEIKTECLACWDEIKPSNALLTKTTATPTLETSDLELLADRPLYCSDILVRHALPLQKTTDQRQNKVALNQTTADSLKVQVGDKLKIKQSDQEFILAVDINNEIADQVVYYASGLADGEMLSARFGSINAEKC